MKKSILTIVAFVFLSFAVRSIAQATSQPRHIDFTQALKGMDGKPILNSDEKPPVPMTLSDASISALLLQTADDQRMSGAEKFRLAQLAQRVYKSKDVVLSVEDLATLKDRIGKICTPLVVGASWPLLDPAQK